MRNIGTVIRFTLRTKMLTKSFVWTTVILALLMTIGVNLPYIISLFSNDQPTKIGMLTGSYPAIEETLSNSFSAQHNPDFNIVATPGTTEEQLKKDVKQIRSMAT